MAHEHHDGGPNSGRAVVVHVIIVSDRSARGERADTSGPRAMEILEGDGYTVTTSVIPDGEESVSAAIRDAIASGARAVITSGGTGISPRDLTPEGTRPLLTRELPGIAEELRRHGASKNRMAVLSRGLAGVAESIGDAPGSPDASGARGASGSPDASASPDASGARGAPGVLIVNLPGSVKAVQEGLQVLLPLLPHIFDQLRGVDH